MKGTTCEHHNLNTVLRDAANLVERQYFFEQSRESTRYSQLQQTGGKY